MRLKTFQGTKSQYVVLHHWVRKQLGKASMCSNKDCLGISQVFDWANISGEYLKDLKDWEQLCRQCHLRKDKRRTVCVRGHALTGYNLVERKRFGHRECRECNRNSLRKHRQRKVEEKK